VLGRKVRGFEFVAPEFRTVSDDELAAQGVERKLPQRATKRSAGYDVFSIEHGIIPPKGKMHFATDVKAYMGDDEVLLAFPRSSQGIKMDVMLSNTTGVIDADYYSNPTNDGHIGVYLRNLGDEPVEIFPGDKLCQVVFVKYLVADHDDPEQLPERVAGTGSTGR